MLGYSHNNILLYFAVCILCRVCNCICQNAVYNITLHGIPQCNALESHFKTFSVDIELKMQSNIINLQKHYVTGCDITVTKHTTV